MCGPVWIFARQIMFCNKLFCLAGKYLKQSCLSFVTYRYCKNEKITYHWLAIKIVLPLICAIGWATVAVLQLEWLGARSNSHRCPTFCYGFRVEQHVSWKRCATGFQIRFLLFGGCVWNVWPISSNMNINHAVLKRPLAQWVQVKSFNMCLLQLGIRNNWRY